MEANFMYLAQELNRLGKISDKYTDTQEDPLQRKAIKITIEYLHELASKDTGSDELMCFGYHVIAKKI